MDTSSPCPVGNLPHDNEFKAKTTRGRVTAVHHLLTHLSAFLSVPKTNQTEAFGKVGGEKRKCAQFVGQNGAYLSDLKSQPCDWSLCQEAWNTGWLLLACGKFDVGGSLPL